MENETRHQLTVSRTIWLWPLSFLTAVSLTVLIVAYLLDLNDPVNGGASLTAVFRDMSSSDARQVLGGIGEVIAAILGIVITVASIIVQLAATRYTPRITDMFFRDRTNLLVMSFFVVSAVFCLWVNFSIRGGDPGSTTQPFVPHYGTLITMGMLTMSLLMMAPYFAYVFDFLEPDKIVGRIQALGVGQALRPPSNETDDMIDRRQMAALSALEQLADIALNAIDQKDKAIASNTVDSISELIAIYVPKKEGLDERWFKIRGNLFKDPDFVSMNAEALEKLSSKRTWLEYKALRQFLMIYRESLTQMPDIINRIAIDTRYIGEAAIKGGDKAAHAIVVKFFNTFMRRALNAKDIAAAYNNLNQYRILTEALLRAGWNDEVIQVANHFKYYAQTAHMMKLAFLTETVAFDLCAINELAYDLEAECRDALLKIFLEVDKEAEVEQQESSLRGVRKAQVKLATYYLHKGEESLARKIWRDMRDEKPDRLRSIKAELLSVTTNEFWEINDRGAVFEYIEPERREHVGKFFEWFPTLSMRTPKPEAVQD